jgi:hypothetical protein
MRLGRLAVLYGVALLAAVAGMTAAGKWAEGVMQMIAFIRAHPR